jgi:glycosyltransferase involved in cell wall biosynthesis
MNSMLIERRAVARVQPASRQEPSRNISIVIPVLNEEQNLEELHKQLTETLSALGRSYEIVFVDDGSTDRTVDICLQLISKDSAITLVQLRRRFGKATALQTGFEMARGEIIFTMDGDLQDVPAEIPNFLARLDEGYDLVSGWKKNRKDSFVKRIESKIFNFITSTVTGLRLQDYNCGFKAYRREVTRNVHLYGELYRFIPALAFAEGFRIGELPVFHRPRVHGKSKYSYERIIRAPFDLFTTFFLCGFRRRPLHLFGPFGAIFGITGFSINTYMAILWFSGQNIGTRPLLMLGTLLMIVGIQIVIFGLLAEMIASTTYQPRQVLNLVRSVTRNEELRGGH